MATLAPAIMALSTSRRGVHAAGQGEIRIDAAMQDGDPAQGQAQVAGCAQVKSVCDLQFFEVEIGLVEAVEEHQSIGACFDEAAEQNLAGRCRRAQLHCQRNLDRRLYLCNQIHLGVFQLLAREWQDRSECSKDSIRGHPRRPPE